jgi:5-bromo-4-chloroindolyl phosphate hydrolysis protein
MGRLYMSIKDDSVKAKINEIIHITDKIVQDAIADPSDVPRIKKFLNYYLPTTIKLLNAYDRMDSQGIEGENLSKTKQNISEMLDTTVEAYKKYFDSLFENQALDIETDIEVMQKLLAREGLAGEKDFNVKSSSDSSSAAAAATQTN